MNFLKGEFHKCCGNSCDFPSAKWPEVVFAGRSNVGKSSIINRIFNMKHIAKTSSSPGKTATINFYAAGNGFLVDLPGYGYAKTSKNEKQNQGQVIADNKSNVSDTEIENNHQTLNPKYTFETFVELSFKSPLTLVALL